MSKKNPVHYVDNIKFHQAIKEYKVKRLEYEAQGLPKPPIPDYIGSCLLKIAQGFFQTYRFRYYSYEEDMISEAVKNCITYFDNFDPDKSNPFAYFTSVVRNSFFQIINSEERYRYKILKNFTQNILCAHETEFMVTEELLTNEELYDNMYSFMANYEKREKEKKEKKKKKALSKLLEQSKKTP